MAKENLMIAETCVQLKEMDKLPKIIEQSTTFADLAQLDYLFRQNNLEEQSQNCINKLMSMEKTNTDYDPKEIPSIPPSQAKVLLPNSSAVILSEYGYISESRDLLKEAKREEAMLKKSLPLQPKS